jgi:hypothetical protein
VHILNRQCGVSSLVFYDFQDTYGGVVFYNTTLIGSVSNLSMSGLARYSQNIVMLGSRVERVVMLSLINLILTQLNRFISMQWIAVFSLATNLVCIVPLNRSREWNVVGSRVVLCASKLSLYIFTHALMRATVPMGHSWSLLLVQGVAVLAALCLLPVGFKKAEEGDQFASQVVYAYAINVESFLNPLMSSRVFNVVCVSVMLTSALMRSTKHTMFGNNNNVLDYILQAFDLIVFDSFTENTFRESGDNFCDLSIVFFIFILLWNVHQYIPGSSSVQQFTTWRVSQYITDIMKRYGMQDDSLVVVAGVLFVVMSLHCIPHPRWSQDLSILVAISACVSLIRVYLDSMVHLDSLPVLLSVTVIVTFANDIVTHGM